MKRAGELVAGRLGRSGAERHYWRSDETFSSLFEQARAHRCDIWLANDWNTLPIAMRLSRLQGVPFAYDTHEMATEEFAHRRGWRLLRRPLIRAIERAGVGASSVVCCVSDGIAQQMTQLYRLERPVLVLRNAPNYVPSPWRPTGDTARILYHGLVSPGRGLEACIRSVTAWASGRSLTIRGPATAEYRAVLEELIRTCGVEDRVVLAPPVPASQLVSEAQAFDVGLFVMSATTAQQRFVLPNKLFEYVMAGLAVVVSDLPDMRRVVTQYDLGALIERSEPDAIAAAVNALDAAAIDRFKQNAIAAARELNWETEATRLDVALRDAVAIHRGNQAPN